MPHMPKGPNNTHERCFFFDCLSPCKCSPYHLTLTHKHPSFHDPQQRHHATACNITQHLHAPMITEPYPTACIQDYKTVQHAYDPMTRTAATCCNIRSWFRHGHRRTVGQDEKDFDVWEVIILRQALQSSKKIPKAHVHTHPTILHRSALNKNKNNLQITISVTATLQEEW